MSQALTDFVTIDTSQTISGVKNFTSNVTAPSYFGDGSNLTNLALSAKPVTYAQLISLRNGGGLKPGNSYILTDFQLTHTVPNTSPAYTWTSPVEQLLLFATSTTALRPEGYSLTYPGDIVYYRSDNSQAAMPGCTKGFIFRRNDTVRNNDMEIDFRNVRFRRWLVTLPRADYNGNTTAYLSATDNGAAYRDFPLASHPSRFSNNRWSGFDQTYNASIFGSINFVADADSPLVNTVVLNSSLVNVTFATGSWFYNSYLIRSTITNMRGPRMNFFNFFSTTAINSTFTDRFIDGSDVTSTVVGSNLTSEYIAYKTLVYGRDMALSLNVPTPSDIKTAVTGAANSGWVNGELTGSQPAGSIPGMRFCDQYFRYEYMSGSNDTNGTTYVWVRNPK